MSQISQQGERFRRSKKSLSEDRISSLPDELLIRVISFLPSTHDAIRISLLSTRWKNLWTCSPNYNFRYNTNGGRAVSYSSMKSFVHCMDTLFNVRDREWNIEKFRISMGFVRYSKFNEWTNHLVSRNIRELDAHFSHGALCQFPSSLLTCKSLVVLKLYGNIICENSSRVSLPKLKTLHLHLDSLRHLNNVSISSLLSCSPVLEEMEISTSHTEVLLANMLNIEVPSLKKLSIASGYISARIVAPCLQKLQIWIAYGSKYTFLNNMPSLLEADVRFSGQKKNGDQVWKLLSSIPNVKKLSYPSCFIKYFNLGYNKFHNMEHLTINCDGYEEDGSEFKWEWFSYLLNSMPKLHTLVFNQGLPGRYNRKIDWCLGPSSLHRWLCVNLKTVEIYHFYGGKGELKMVEYFLENIIVLESVIIHIYKANESSAEDEIRVQLKNRLKNAQLLEKVTIL